MFRTDKMTFKVPTAQDHQLPIAIEEDSNSLERVGRSRYDLRDRRSNQNIDLDAGYTSIFGASIKKEHYAKERVKDEEVTAMVGADKSETFPFFELPRELRDRIYEESMVSARVKAAEYYMFSKSTVRITNVPNRGLLFASKDTKQKFEETIARTTLRHRIIIEYHDYDGPITRDVFERQQRAEGNTAKPVPSQATIAKTVELLAKAEYIDVHIPASFEWAKAVKFSKLCYTLSSEDIRHAIQRIVPHMPKLRAATMIRHLSDGDDLSRDFLSQRTLLMQSSWCIFGNLSSSKSSHLGLMRTHNEINHFGQDCKIITSSPNFISTIGSYPGVDPNGRFSDFIKNHRRNRLLLEWSICRHDTRDLAGDAVWLGDIALLPFRGLATYDEIEDEVLAGLLAVYEGEKTMKDLDKEFPEPSTHEHGFVVDPEQYGEYLDSK